MLIKRFFVIRDQGVIFAHTADLSWDYNKFGPVYLIINDLKIFCRYIAIGTLKDDEFIVVLKPNDKNYSLEDLYKIQHGEIYRIELFRAGKSEEQGSGLES